MSSAGVTKRPNGSYLARYRGPDGRERSKSFAKAGDADRWRRAELAKMDRAEWTDPRMAEATIAELGSTWLAGKAGLKPSTRATYDALLRTHVNPVWGRVPVGKVRHEDVATWVQRMTARGLSASRTRQAFIVLGQVLELAVRSRRIPANPARGVELPSLTTAAHERGEMRALTQGQVWALAEAAGEQRLAVLTLACCGLRFGELAGLRAGRVDLLRRELRVEATLSEVGGRLMEGTPKTRGSRRTVPLPGWLADELAPLLAGKAAGEYVLTAAGGRAAPARPAAHRGEPAHQARHAREGAVHPARARLGIDHAGPLRPPLPGGRSGVRGPARGGRARRSCGLPAD